MIVLINMEVVFLLVNNLVQIVSFIFFYAIDQHVLFFIVAGIAMLVAAGFFGYMLALLQRRVGTIMSSQEVSNLLPSAPYKINIYSFDGV